MAVGDKSGLVADWSTLVDIWERAAHLKVEQGKHDQGLVDFDSRIGRHRPEVSRRRLTSASERSTPTSPSTRMGRACGEQGPWGEIKLFNLERWRTRVSKVSSSSFFEGPRTRVSKVSSSSFFEGPPPRLKSWSSHLGARGVPLDDTSGLVADWSR